ncbi:Uncharacterised protein [Serratia quinivorans]|nr:Uncharacterised protein [Serratia quinivorans]
MDDKKLKTLAAVLAKGLKAKLRPTLLSFPVCWRNIPLKQRLMLN